MGYEITIPGNAYTHLSLIQKNIFCLSYEKDDLSIKLFQA